MSVRPTFIDIESGNPTALDSQQLASPVPPPRVQHVDGDVPPALSPLDAIAAHSRRLAKELEETRRAGERRMSRLPPHVVTASLTEHQANRPQIFRSLSDQREGGATPPDRDGSGNSPVFSNPSKRPVSSYPRISRVLEPAGSAEGDNGHPPTEQAGPDTPQPATPRDYFGTIRTVSPEMLEPSGPPMQEETTRLADTPEPTAARLQSTASHPDLTFTLVAPNAAFARKSNHLRLQHDSSDDDFAGSNTGSTFSQHRKLSSNSGMSVPLSPASPLVPAHARSPSGTSEQSDFSPRKSRSNLNFSRPISSASLNNLKLDQPLRQQGSRSPYTQQSFHSFDLPRTPTSFDDARSEVSEGHVSGPSSSYTYGKFTLPRGRKVQRDSAIFSGLTTPHFEWQEPMFPSTPPLKAMSERGLDTPSPPSTGIGARSFDIARARAGNAGFSFEFDVEKPVTQEAATGSSISTCSPTASARSATSTATRPSTERNPSPPPVMPAMPLPMPDTNSISSRSNSTIRPPHTRSDSSYHAMSAEEHVTKAIALHQNGGLKESTYHLRIAAKQGHSTGMLLYALACRHGWGMRSNQKEGVQWLRKAVDCAMLEVADDEDASSNAPVRDLGEKKAHRAQFALSIYELGVSHLNGWGIEQDKALALQCFEIAGNWGDVDALTEAGFCYTQGIGCKKDLKKAAKLYRTAGAKGASMVGNSWIYKEKYDDKDDDREGRARPGEAAAKPRNKSRTRSIFLRKKSLQP